MNRPEKPAFRQTKTTKSDQTNYVGLAGLIASSVLGCQVIAGLEDLKLANEVDGGIDGSGGSVGETSSSSSVSSSSGEPIMGDIACGGTTCPIGLESACCSDHYQTNSSPFVECVTGPPSNDSCNTAGGANGYETRIECQLPSHCPQGTVCCGNIETISVFTWYVTLSCAATCAWPDTVVCDPMNPMNCPVVDNNSTMVQTVCAASDLLPPEYGVCKLPP